MTDYVVVLECCFQRRFPGVLGAGNPAETSRRSLPSNEMYEHRQSSKFSLPLSPRLATAQNC
ncbi:hypothetical protein NQ314_007245 [Rhamnusium bicolor]|uniref:Uncharacterized protein n=1 Tax=Rhamnusium bicolor TaxID=1586634 RepID=A0AAV8YQL4_9CUCU|nr:hypothetical protein NQ314_007245 [Rhamnusium bicolor]